MELKTDDRERMLAGLAIAIANIVEGYSQVIGELKGKIDALTKEPESKQRDYEKLFEKHGEKQPDPCPPADRILPPCLRWTKERPVGVKAWLVSDDLFLCGYDRGVSNAVNPANGWLSFREVAP